MYSTVLYSRVGLYVHTDQLLTVRCVHRVALRDKGKEKLRSGFRGRLFPAAAVATVCFPWSIM